MLLHLRRSRRNFSSSSDFAAVRAILNYYEISFTQDTLETYIGHHSFGTLITEVAECLHNHGVLSTIVTANPFIFERGAWDTFQLKKVGRNQMEEFQINEYVRVIELGVKLQPEVPTEGIIDEQLRHHHPVLILLDSGMIHSTLGTDMDYGIITGYDNESYTIVDFSAGGRARKFPKNVVMFALHAVSSGNPTSGAIILTEPLKKTR
jgi:hypothetical protein